MKQDFIVFGIGFFSLCSLFTSGYFIDSTLTNIKKEKENWWVRLLVIILSFATLFLPGFFIWIYITKTKAFKTLRYLKRFLNAFYFGNDDTITQSKNGKSYSPKWLKLCYLFGIFGLFLGYSLIQEHVFKMKFVR